jgi:adenosine deaminase
LIDKGATVIKNIDDKLNDSYKRNIDDLTRTTSKTIEKYQELQEKANKRFESYYNRKKIIDYLVYINLAITPFLIIYLIFIK